jgi:hypothetical protein
MQVLMSRIGIFFAALLLAAAMASPVNAEEGLQLHEREIKAGLLYNFLKYTEYPESALSGASSISVCLFGGDPFGGYLDHTKGLTVHEKPISVRVITSAGEAGGCQLVFINAGASDRWGQLRAELAGKEVLTVSDFGGFTGAGGMIEFTRSGDHVGALLNMNAVNAAKLHVGSRMLRLVTVVHGGG